MKKVLIITSAIILLSILVRFLITKHSEITRQKALQEASIPTVELSDVKKIDTYKSIEIPGRIQSQDKVDLVARIDGYLQTKHFKEGDFVKKGQVLFTIEPTQYLNNLNIALADLENAKATLYRAQKDYQRGAELVKKDFISKSTYDSLYSDQQAAAAAVKSATARVAEARRNYNYTKIKSPTDGKIGSLNIQEGNYVTTASGTIATVTKTNPIYVKYSVDSKQFEELRNLDFIPKKGEAPVKAEIVLPSGNIYPIKATQDFWDNQISTSTGTIDFRATVSNPDNILIPGDFVKVKVYSNQKINSLVVPQEFVLQDTKGKYVYVVDKDNILQIKYFKDAGQYDKYWLISEGLDINDKYVITNLTTLMPKMKVKIKQSEQTAQ